MIPEPELQIWKIGNKKHLLQNHLDNFNQTWHTVSLGEGDSNEGPAIFQGEIIKKTGKIH